MLEYIKVYVPVWLRADVDGNITPIALEWENGRLYMIDRVVGAYMAPPEHVGAVLTKKYDVTVERRPRVLYEETHTGKWFVECAVSRDTAGRNKSN